MLERNRTRGQLHGAAQFLDSIRGLIDKETGEANPSKQIKDNIIKLGRFSEFPEEVMQTSILAAYFYRVGTVADTQEKTSKKLDPELLKKSEQIIKGVLQYPELGEAIRHVGENYDGNGVPDGIKGEDIPLSSRILRIVHDYTQIIMERKLSEKEAAGFIVQHKDTLYDPKIARDLFSMQASEPEREQDEYNKVRVTELKQGMKLADDLYLDNGVFYLAANTKVTEEIRRRIRNCALDNSFPLDKERTIGVSK
ncbi:MAG: HD domain-containing phosphohydrolase [Spirochaetia bacterium]